jgi:hypothetical protein
MINLHPFIRLRCSLSPISVDRLHLQALFLVLLLLLLNLVTASVIHARANAVQPQYLAAIDPLFYFTGTTDAPRPITQGERLSCIVNSTGPAGQVEMFCRPAPQARAPRQPRKAER